MKKCQFLVSVFSIMLAWIEPARSHPGDDAMHRHCYEKKNKNLCFTPSGYLENEFLCAWTTANTSETSQTFGGACVECGIYTENECKGSKNACAWTASNTSCTTNLTHAFNRNPSCNLGLCRDWLTRSECNKYKSCFQNPSDPKCVNTPETCQYACRTCTYSDLEYDLAIHTFNPERQRGMYTTCGQLKSYYDDWCKCGDASKKLWVHSLVHNRSSYHVAAQSQPSTFNAADHVATTCRDFKRLHKSEWNCCGKPANTVLPIPVVGYEDYILSQLKADGSYE